MHVTAIIAAGGRGERFGGAEPKQLLVVAGRPILERSVAAFLSHPEVREVVVALPAALLAAPPPYLRGASERLRLVAGGSRRQDSVAAAFQAVSESTDVVVIHDAARPFVSADLISRTVAAAAESGAALAAVQARDTVKRVVAGARAGTLSVATTLPREWIYLAQTPQAFRRGVLRDALALGGRQDVTDEATLAERAGHPVQIVEGDAWNLKITTPGDVTVAEGIARSLGETDGGIASTDARARQITHVAQPLESAVRVGTGYDLHRFVEGRPLILAGVHVPFERGLLGHSDADAICHAVTDAVLGAAAAGDIGRHFPDTDPQWRGASSIELLRRAVEIVRARGFVVWNVDVVVILERPKLGPHVDRMRAMLAETLGVFPDAVGIKAKTNEGVGALGRGEAIAVHAVATVRGR